MARAWLPLQVEDMNLSYRQYDHWAVKGWIERPVKKGRGLSFTDKQLDRIALMAELVNVTGFPPARAAELLDNNVVSGSGRHIVLLVGRTTMEVRA